MTLALIRGQEDYREHLGRDANWYLAADTYDAINQNTRATGQWKNGKAPKFDAYPRPGVDVKGRGKKNGKKPRTLADLYGQLSPTDPNAVPNAGGDLWQTPS